MDQKKHLLFRMFRQGINWARRTFGTAHVKWKDAHSKWGG